MVRIERGTALNHGPQDAGVLVGQRDGGLLPARAGVQRHLPAADRVAAPGRTEHGRLGTLDQQAAQVVVAPFGDTREPGLAASGVLARRQAQPRAELVGAVELPEVADTRRQGAGGDRPDAHERGGPLSSLVVSQVCGDALVAPLEFLLQRDPMLVCPLQRQTRDAGQLVGRVLQHLGKHPAQLLGTLREDKPELGKQAADLVNAGGALLLVALAHAVHSELGLLLGALDRHEAHLRPAGGLANGSSVVGVVLAALASHAVGRDQVAGDEAGIEAQKPQTAGGVVGAAADLHRHQAARGQPAGSWTHHAWKRSGDMGFATIRLPARSTACTW